MEQDFRAMLQKGMQGVPGYPTSAKLEILHDIQFLEMILVMLNWKHIEAIDEIANNDWSMEKYADVKDIVVHGIIQHEYPKGVNDRKWKSPWPWPGERQSSNDLCFQKW